MSTNTEQASIAKKRIALTPDDCVTKDMRMLLQNLADLANQVSDEVYDDDDSNHGTAGILSLCDLLVAKIDAYLEN